MKNCFGCRFAKEARNHVRNGQEVRCGKAEELFGGTRWVKVLPEAKCGTFESFQGDDSRAPDKEAPQKVKKVCGHCKGSTQVRMINIYDKVELVKCHVCNGKGSIE
jgi:DnaJ-class molecular chaperone